MNFFDQLKKYRNYIIAAFILSIILIIGGALIKLEAGNEVLITTFLFGGIILHPLSLLLFMLSFIKTEKSGVSEA